jgi:hypothetical protein
MRQLPAIIRGATLDAALSARANAARRATCRGTESVMVAATRFASPDATVSEQTDTELPGKPNLADRSSR